MPELIIYHSGDCSKSNSALTLLQERKIPHIIRWYLVEPFTQKELLTVLSKLSLKISDIVRRQEPVYKEKFEGKVFAEEIWVDILLTHPTLIERPIVMNETVAVIARPAKRLLELL